MLTDAEYERPGFEGAKFVCSPPLRQAHDRPRLWHALAAGGLQTVGTDHCPFFFVGQKDLAFGSRRAAMPAFNQIPADFLAWRLALPCFIPLACGQAG